jgi:hypothetical protein
MPGHDGGRLDPDRGLVSLAAGGRHGLEPHQVYDHVQALAGGLDVLAGVSTPEQAEAMSVIWNRLGPCLDALVGTDVVADVGRVGPTSASLVSAFPVLLASRLVVMVCRPDLSSVVHMRERLGMLTPILRPRAVDGVPLCVVVVAPPNQRRAVEGVHEVIKREHPEVVVAGQLAYDPKGAAFFNGEPSGRVDRSPLVRSGRLLAGRLAGAIAPFWREKPTRIPFPVGYPQERQAVPGAPVGRPALTRPAVARSQATGPPAARPPSHYGDRPVLASWPPPVAVNGASAPAAALPAGVGAGQLARPAAAPGSTPSGPPPAGPPPIGPPPVGPQLAGPPPVGAAPVGPQLAGGAPPVGQLPAGPPPAALPPGSPRPAEHPPAPAGYRPAGQQPARLPPEAPAAARSPQAGVPGDFGVPQPPTDPPRQVPGAAVPPTVFVAPWRVEAEPDRPGGGPHPGDNS